ncbi:putative ADP-ribosylglycohydrolase [Leishmania naiffi]|uniref:ADP-ribosylglycohydrolase n=1 Tax=Leishmania naiffi TaxID=5678 RepID=A0AAW3BLB8_9TRYP
MMVATLVHTPPPVVGNFYQNSFKQLSLVQQQQVGLLVGVAVADAAARPLNGYSPEQVETYLKNKREETRGAASGPTTVAETESSFLAFARVPPQEIKARNDAEHSSEDRSPVASSLLLASSSAPHFVHSFTYQLYFEMLRAMSSARGEFSVDYVQERLVRVAAEVDAQQTFAAEHASLLHTLCTLLPTPAIYPYASDAALRRYLEPFTAFLTESPMPLQVVDADCGSFAEAAATERAAVRDYTFSVLGVVLRQLQSNPDATRNAAFMAVPGTGAVFPADVRPFVPSTVAVSAETRASPCRAQRHVTTRTTSMSSSAMAGTGWLPRRRTAADTATVCEGLSIARGPVTFAQGVAQAIRLGGPTCQRAMLVGALLGAKLGVRHIPMEWLSATADHKPVSTMALEVAQWSWNPPHH